MLDIKDLHVSFQGKKNVVKAVEGVSLSLAEEETLAVVGESGCGKSVTALSIMRLVTGRSVSTRGSIYFRNKNLLSLSEREMQSIRGNDISMIFQEPMKSLNPLHKNGNQVMEVILAHNKISKKLAEEQVVDVFNKVGIPDPEQKMNDYPFRLSGGMRQRVMIAIALACRPSLLIADEPTTALDVTIQAQILKEIRELKKTFRTSILFITHDLGVVAQIADRVVVMYAGFVVEEAPVIEIFTNPMHPYTRGLLNSLPHESAEFKSRLPVIKGVVPSAQNKPIGCPFSPRCSDVLDKCHDNLPQIELIRSNHKVRCWLYEECEVHLP